MTLLPNEEQKRQFHLVAMPRFNNTQTILAQLHLRDENLRYCNQLGRKEWKQQNGYHRHSLSETAMFRLKIIFGGKLRRFFDNQAVELFLQCAALNRMIQLGKPDTYKVEG